ncbi:ArsR family transcriptional regulator [Candidatus Kryptonium thompsonii]|jgi:ArsR family transcriptional regulator|uniref:ArsR family transcriptional regulator n=1 Tax=Candidatus Kryptonium thompsonii TaxID=1633631 RepID=A0A0P1LW84_9BACT|nr:metalloregulator ArsR/SmtB family transcription factor [Candidatus Kryptonium thompsoni]CUS77411.1 ArsR family transcriptional regulator [Candidatus Kryptonium thompsoni]CUS78797.1 ArsR family transcriptional regulator [Candidatus Kryptonium thompsoni]CUS86453.1 transcriptional regulator, ArsR family [Candidatus Kryptonium thompsoni]CUS88230.1 ArsR family transcriptional regulator [Candidatus Kryptonium thompsoni]CUS89470.1 ArsR family transcriptional regulator [Candidatus Kryptonium thomps
MREKVFDYTQMAETLKVLGHPVRLRIISELIGSDKTVSELWHSVGLPQSLVSQHLSILRHSGIIKSVRKGRLVYYSVVSPIAVRILNLIQKQK